MTSTRRWLLHALLPLLPLIGSNLLTAAALIDDQAITVHSEADVTEKRRQLVRYLWGTNGFPEHRLPKVTTNIPSPVAHLSRVARVDEFRIATAPGFEALAYHFVPEQPNRELVVVHHGHACTLDDDPGPENAGYGLQRTIHALLRAGYGVLGVFMPHMQPGDCTDGHDAMFNGATNEANGSPLRFFLEPTAISLNYLQTQSQAGHFPEYCTFHMTGLSGGGWTTTVYAAIDVRIRFSFPVAGTMPLYLRTGGSVGDREQYEPSFYGIAGYPDLYLLGSSGAGRRQVQILLRRDDCCFGEAQHDARRAGTSYAEVLRAYESRVQSVLRTMGPGTFDLVIDETAPSHMISQHVVREVLLAALRKTK